MDQYSVLSMIGEGSFGRVYKAISKTTQKTVAMKVIGKRGRTVKEIQNLRGECDIQTNLCHPNIIRMLDSFETNDEIVVITEYAQSDLHKLLSREGSIGEARARKLTYDLVSALYYLHSHRILHRDLKPQNILLDKDEQAKLCDFGLARNMTMGTHVLTSIKGTPLYMAPELLSEKPYDHQADLWSLGCIIYETLAGEPPFCTTSFIRLVRLIRHVNVKWPSFLSEKCISFLKGLLEKEPSSRMTWTQILCHPFVKEKIIILDENIKNSPFTHSINVENESQKITASKPVLAINDNEEFQPEKLPSVTKTEACLTLEENITSSRDSVCAILQSDLEPFETDIDEPKTNLYTNTNISDSIEYKENESYLNDILSNTFFVPGNSNLIVNNFDDNFLHPTNQNTISHDAALKSNMKKVIADKINNFTYRKVTTNHNKNRELEKRKLNQNLLNFSMRLGRSSVTRNAKNTIDINCDAKDNTQDMEKNIQIKDKTPPSMLPGWDSCVEYQSPPIETDEWLAFLYRSMQEILDGELESLKQQNLVSIIVAPLRNYKASCKVIECVVQLLSIPLVVGRIQTNFSDIQKVYVEVKLVPNLIYASKLLCTERLEEYNKNNSLALNPTSVSHLNMKMLSSEQLNTISSIYDLVCHLVHLCDQFLSQFCDAVAILGASELIVSFISTVSDDDISIRITNSMLALLCCALRELPENADLVEKIIFDPNINIINLMKNNNNLLKARICMLLRMTGRFSCCALQNSWTVQLKEILELLIYDSNTLVRNEALGCFEEFKHLSFYGN